MPGARLGGPQADEVIDEALACITVSRIVGRLISDGNSPTISMYTSRVALR
jgi:hypothetical protein